MANVKATDYREYPLPHEMPKTDKGKATITPPPPPPPEPSKPSPQPPEPPEPSPTMGTEVVEIPKDATPVEFHALHGGGPTDVDRSRPTVYKKGGIKYYTPDSAMYRLGFRTSAEYQEAQKKGVELGHHETAPEVGKGSVLVEDKGQLFRVTPGELAKGDLSETLIRKIQKEQYRVPVTATSKKGEKAQILLTPKVYEGYSKLKGEQKFNRAVELGIIPAGAIYQGAGKWAITDEKESILALRTFAQQMKSEEMPLELKEAYKKGGIDAYNKAVEKYNKRVNKERSEWEQTVLPELPPEVRKWYNPDDPQKMKRFDKAFRVHNLSIQALNIGIREHQRQYDSLIKDLKPYQDGEHYDLAKYLRNNPSKADELVKAGVFEQADIKQATEYNQKYLGVGAPEYIPRNEFIRNYYKDKGWEYHAIHTNATDIKRTEEAFAEWEKTYRPQITLAEFQRAYFADKGWEYKPSMPVFGASFEEKGKQVQQTLEQGVKLAEATKAYTDKYGALPVVKQAINNIADFTIPGLYLAKNWKQLDAGAKAVNIAIDVAFVGLIFARPISAGVRTVFRGTFGTTGERVVTNRLAAIRQAIKKGDAIAIRQEAQAMKVAGQQMQKRKIVGAENVIKKSESIIQNADNLAALKKTKMPVDIKKATDSLGKFGQKLVTEEAGYIKLERPGIQYQRKLGTVSGTPTVKTYPITRQEAKAWGLTDKQVDDIARMAKTDEDFIKLAKERGTENKKFWEEINEVAERYMKSPGKPEPTSPRKPVEKMLPPEIKELSKKLAATKNKTEARRIAREIGDKIREYAGMGKPKSAAQLLVEKARLYEAFITNLAAKKIAQLKGMQIKQPETIARNNAFLVLAATNPGLLNAILTRADTKTKTLAKTQLSPQLYTLVRTGNLSKTKTEAQTKIQALPLTSTKIATTARTKTKADTRLKTLTITRAKPLPKTLTVAKPAPKEGVKFAPTELPPQKLRPVPLKPLKEKPPEKKKPKPKPEPEFEPEEEKKKPMTLEEIRSAIAWRQGKLRRDGKLQPVTIAIKEPYQASDKVVLVGKTPPGLRVAPDEASAYETIQLLRGKSPKEVKTKVGFMTARVTSPDRIPGGGKGEISFTPRSTKRGKIYYTPVKGGTLLSRHSLSNKRRGT